MDEAALRRSLTDLVKGKGAHVPLAKAVGALPARLRTVRPPGGVHSVWELVEHIRLAQKDILRYTLDPSWVSPPWPEGYWPGDVPRTLPDEAWEGALADLQADLDSVVALVEDPAVDLSAAIPHGEGRTYLREVLLVADHTAYHTAQIVDVRRALDAWPPAP